MKKQFLITKISKHLFYAMLAVCVFGGLFGCSKRLDNPKYKIGDIVFLKPDSVKAIIIDDDVILGEYEIDYTDKGIFREFTSEKNIYGKE